MSREDVEARYASTSDDELTALQRSELTDVARNCLDQELNRRGMVPRSETTLHQAPPSLPRQVISVDTPTHRRMAKHVKFIAYSALVLGVLFLIAPFLELIPKTPMPGFYAPSGVGGFNPRMAAFTVIVFALPLLCIFVGLRRFRPWGRTITLALAMITFALPISWYVLWVLTRLESKDLFSLVAKPKATGFKKFAIVTGYTIAAPIVIIGNVGLVTALVKDVASPPTRVRPIGEIITGLGSAAGYCGMDASGKLIPGGQPVTVRGVVVATNEGARAYMLADGPSLGDGISVIVNKQFPMPAGNAKLEILGLVQCSSPLKPRLLEAARFPWRLSPDEGKVISAKGDMWMLGLSLLAYQREIGSFPSTAQGLRALRERPNGIRSWNGPYGQTPKDPWGHDYVYHYPGDHGDAPEVICLGADGQPGGEGLNKDIVSWRDR